MRIAPIEEVDRNSIHSILEASLQHERTALGHYRDLLALVEQRSVFLEEFARGQISAEEQHQLELRKMLRDFSVS